MAGVLRAHRCAGGDDGPRRRRVRGATHRAALLVAGPGSAGPDHPAGGCVGAAHRRSPRWSTGSTRSAARHHVVCATFGHAGDGNLHPTIVFDPADGDVQQRAEAAFADVFDAAIELGGTITGEHGVGSAKRPYLEKRLGADQIGAAAPAQASVRPGRHPQPGQARLMNDLPVHAASGGPTSPLPGHTATRSGPPTATRGIFDAAPVLGVHLVRLLPAGVPDLCAEPGRELEPARADHPHAGARGRPPGPRRPDPAGARPASAWAAGPARRCARPVCSTASCSSSGATISGAGRHTPLVAGGLRMRACG
jgi:hypothetical protein